MSSSPPVAHGGCSPDVNAPVTISSVQVFTHNITRRPIAWDPARQRPTQELVHAIHSALHFALDPCVNHPHEKPSYCVLDAPSTSTSNAISGEVEAPSSTSSSPSTPHRAPEAQTLVIPCISALEHSLPSSPPPLASSPAELTVKLFAGFNDVPLSVSTVKAALDGVRRSIGSLRTIDKFIVSLEGVKWGGQFPSVECPCPQGDKCGDWETGMQQIDAMVDAWEYLSSQPDIGQLGVADFSDMHLTHLHHVLNSRVSKPSPAYDSSTEADASASGNASKSTTLKHPTIDQLNFDEDLPPQFSTSSKAKGVSLVAHSDELGTPLQMLNLLREFKGTLPLPKEWSAPTINAERVDEIFKMDWVLKYTILIPDRGLVADNGYIIAANLPTAKA